MKTLKILFILSLSIYARAWTYESVNLQKPPLKDLALSHKRLFGSAVDSGLLDKDKVYTEIVKRDFSIIVPIDELKFKFVQPSKDRFDFERMDRIVQFAKVNKIKVRGFAPVWHNPKALPDWLKSNKFSSKQLRNILKEHIQTVFAHYKDSNDIFECWEVANEVFNVKNEFKKSIWSAIEADPKKFLKLVFTWAHEANPKAKLFYNDAGHEFSGKKSDVIFEAMKELKAGGVPIHGIGFQMHLGWGEKFDLADLKKTFRRFADLGLEIHITEFDVPIEDKNKSASALETQANKYYDVISACLSEPKCTTIVTWGFSDKHSWIPQFKPGFGRALYLDENYSPKPAYYSLIKAFSPEVPKEKPLTKMKKPQKIGIGVWDVDKLGTSFKLINDMGFQWYYNWKTTRLYSTVKSDKKNTAQFIPMVWGEKNLDMPDTESKVLLGFNEPDNKDQSNLTVERALELWPQLQKHKVKLCSPAPTKRQTVGTSSWLNQFMQYAEEKKYRVDLICVHYYSDNKDVGEFKSFLERVYTTYKRPIWVTEWGLVDWAETGRFSFEETAQYAKEALPMLDELDFVERHAWFAAYKGKFGLQTELFDEKNKLTKVGEIFKEALNDK